MNCMNLCNALKELAYNCTYKINKEYSWQDALLQWLFLLDTFLDMVTVCMYV